MYLTGGQFKGFKLLMPKGGVRPTLSVTRESVFSMLATHFERVGGDFSGLSFLDCFSGSGIMALEAFSRGFEVNAIEKNRDIARTIKENFKKVCDKNLKEAPVIIADALNFKTDKRFDVVYVDPPWDKDYTEIMSVVTKLGRVIIFEHDKELPKHNLKILKEKKYGRTRLTILEAILLD